MGLEICLDTGVGHGGTSGVVVQQLAQCFVGDDDLEIVGIEKVIRLDVL